MSNIDRIKTEILTLTLSKFQRLRQWIFDIDYQRWNKQVERDISEGKLDILLEEAISEFEAGQCRKI